VLIASGENQAEDTADNEGKGEGHAAPMTGRRRFLLGGLGCLGLGGAMVLGWGLMPPRQRLNTAEPLQATRGAVPLNGWIAVTPGGIVVLAMPRSEMGQGIYTALPMLMAEELDVPLVSVRLMQAPLDKIFSNVAVMRDTLPFRPDDHGPLRTASEWLLAKAAREMGIVLTGGSTSIRDAWLPLREAGASARAMLVAVAAEEWGVPPGECLTAAGHVLHGTKRSPYGSLAARAALLDSVPGPLRLKEPAEFSLIGQPAPRRDTPVKTTGKAIFGIDVRHSGMLYAAVRMAPVIGAGLAGFDADAVRRMDGVTGVVDLSAALADHAGALPTSGAGAGVAVLATSYWRAKKAAEALPVRWSASPQSSLSSEAILRDFAARLDHEDGHAYHLAGDVTAAAATPGARSVSAEYRVPFLAHAAMEPVNCTAQVSEGKVRLWLSTQAPSFAVRMAARVAGVSVDDVSIEVRLLGGSFGRRLEVDMVAQAVAIAMHAGGAPVQLIWSREDDIRHDLYRPAALARFTGSLAADGGLLAWQSRSVSGSLGHQFTQRNLGLPGVGPDKATIEGAYDMCYEIAHQRVAHVIADSAVALGYWRSVGHSHNAFFKESFVDELAHAAGRDGAAFRRTLLQKHPRHLAVLEAAVVRAGTAPAGRAHGLALHESYGSIVCQVAEVSVAGQGSGRDIVVHRVVCAIDCGIAVNPNIIAQQMESGVIFGLSAALSGAITIKDGRIEQSNFHDYPVLRMDRAPVVETVIIPSAEPPQGVGEPGVPPIAPAVANALFVLTGQRLRSLPLRLA
jgi:isoquinoline 1-oxidoreductase beta subunit